MNNHDEVDVVEVTLTFETPGKIDIIVDSGVPLFAEGTLKFGAIVVDEHFLFEEILEYVFHLDIVSYFEEKGI